MTGIPDEVACLIAGDNAAASGIVTTSPFGFVAAACEMSEASSCGLVVEGER